MTDFGAHTIPYYKRVKQVRVKTYVDDNLEFYIDGVLRLETNVFDDTYNIDKTVYLTLNKSTIEIKARAINTGGPCEIRGMTLYFIYSN